MTSKEKDQESIKENGENTDIHNNEAGELEKIPYPKSVFFIVCNEFCERFSYYGMRTVLVLYLTDILLFSEPDSKIIYHTFTMFVYFFPVFGAILADSYLGKFNTIFYVSMIYAVGNVLLALTAAEPLHIPQKAFSIVSLLLIALGTGGIKPCVNAFGGDQFVLPQQARQLEMFFSFFYFSINAGSLISTILTPVLRNDVKCFGADSCFPLAYAIPGILMVISIVIFGLGKPLYKIKKPSGNIVVEVVKCISHAISQKFKSKEPVDHWLDRSKDKFGKTLVHDVKATLKVLIIYIPLPIFWALYDQQGSAWTFQAVQMDGDIGFLTILPDQMQVVNPILILIFIPLFSYCIYPLLAKCNLMKTPLQKMVVGGFLGAVAFAVSGIISVTIEQTNPVEPSSGNIQLRFYNPSECNYSISTSIELIDITHINAYDRAFKTDVKFKGTQNVTFTWNPTNGCQSYDIPVELKEKTAYGVYIIDDDNRYRSFKDDVSKSEDGYPKVRTLAYKPSGEIKYVHVDNDEKLIVAANDSSLLSAPSNGKYHIYIGEKKVDTVVEFKLGGTYTVMINELGGINVFTVTEPNSVHMLWLLPQYFIITAAEIMFSITGFEFSYSQAPVAMKSVLQACFLLTTAIGNLIIVLIESAKIFDKQSNVFFLYTGLMVLDMILFTVLAIRYKYVDFNNSDNGNDGEDDKAALEEPAKKISNAIENPTFKLEDEK